MNNTERERKKKIRKLEYASYATPVPIRKEARLFFMTMMMF